MRTRNHNFPGVEHPQGEYVKEIANSIKLDWDKVPHISTVSQNLRHDVMAILCEITLFSMRNKFDQFVEILHYFDIGVTFWRVDKCEIYVVQ